MTRPGDPALIAGAAVLGLAALAFGGAVAGALIAGPPEAPAAVVSSDAEGSPAMDDPTASDVVVSASPEAVPGNAETAVSAERAVSDDVLQIAVEKAPFDPERRVSEPYLLPDERPQPRPARVERPEPPPAPAFRVLGTVADRRGGVAVIEAPGEPPRVVALGEEILGYRLSSIQEGRVVLGTEEGRSVSVAVPEVAPRAATEARVTRETQNGNQRGGGRGAAGRGGANGADAANLVNEAMRRLREQTGGDVRMEMRGDRVILTAPDGTRREIQIGGGGGGGGDFFDFQMEAPMPPPPARPRRPGGGE